jgi:hypothetical protein
VLPRGLPAANGPTHRPSAAAADDAEAAGVADDHGDVAVEVGAADQGADPQVGRDRARGGVAVVVVEPDADERHRRSCRRGPGGRLLGRAVVRHLHDVDVPEPARRQDGVLRRGLEVTVEEHGRATDVGHHRHARVVRVAPLPAQQPGGPHHAQPDAAHCPDVAGRRDALAGPGVTQPPAHPALLPRGLGER